MANRSLLPQTKYLYLISTDDVAKVSGPVPNLDGVRKSINRVRLIRSTKAVVENATDARLVDKVNKNISADAIAGSLFRNEWKT